MSFPETPDDPAPEKTTEETPAVEPSGKAKEGPQEAKTPQDKKPLPLGLIGGILGGLVLIGALVFFLKKPSTPTVGMEPVAVPTGPASPSPVLTVPAATPTGSPTSTPVLVPTAVKAAPVVKRAAAEPTHTSTPKPQPTVTPTPTDIPLDDKDPEKSPDNASVPPTATHTGDLLESSEPANTPTQTALPVATSAP
jgi:hypothetical protein